MKNNNVLKFIILKVIPGMISFLIGIIILSFLIGYVSNENPDNNLFFIICFGILSALFIIAGIRCFYPEKFESGQVWFYKFSDYQISSIGLIFILIMIIIFGKRCYDSEVEYKKCFEENLSSGMNDYEAHTTCGGGPFY